MADSDVQKRFGARVAEIRKLKAISQEELALSSGLDRSYVGSVERGQRNISIANIYKLATALGVGPGDLLQSLDGEGS